MMPPTPEHEPGQRAGKRRNLARAADFGGDVLERDRR